MDINSDRIGLAKKVTVGICGDAKLVARQILEQLSSGAGDKDREERRALIHQTKSAWLQSLTSMDHEDDDPGTTWNAESRERDPDFMSPRIAWRAIQAALPKDAIISSDIGNNCAIGNAYPIFEEGRKYLAPGLFGPCGYGFPSILGAKIGCPDKPVVCFSGDGGFLMGSSEIATAVKYGVNVIGIVINDGALTSIKASQQKAFRGRTIDTNMINPDFVELAKSFGAKGKRVKSLDKFKKVLEEALVNQGPTIIEAVSYTHLTLPTILLV